MDFRIEPAKPEQRRPKPTDESSLGFGKIYSDHMFTMRWTSDGGWSDPAVAPFSNLDLSPASLVLHYGQTIFEGLKAYRNRNRDGTVNLFRAADNAGAFQLLGGAPRSARGGPGHLRRRGRSAPRARPRMDPPIARNIAVRAADDDRDRTLHRAQVHPRSPVLHHHRPGRRLLPRRLQPGEDLGLREVLAGRPGRARSGQDGGELRGEPQGGEGRPSRAASPRSCGSMRRSTGTSRKWAR